MSECYFNFWDIILIFKQKNMSLLEIDLFFSVNSVLDIFATQCNILLFRGENLTLIRNSVICMGNYKLPGLSIKFEVGGWFEKSNRLYEQGAVRPLNLKVGGSGGMLPQEILKSGNSEVPFPAFWPPN